MSMWFRHRRFSTVKLSCNGLQSYTGPTDSYSEAKCSYITCSGIYKADFLNINKGHSDLFYVWLVCWVLLTHKSKAPSSYISQCKGY